SLHSLFFSHAPPTPETYTLSLHDALPICGRAWCNVRNGELRWRRGVLRFVELRQRVELFRVKDKSLPSSIIFDNLVKPDLDVVRSEEHTSELQSLAYLVCRLLLEKKKKTK